MKPHVANREREIELAALRCDEEGARLLKWKGASPERIGGTQTDIMMNAKRVELQRQLEAVEAEKEKTKLQLKTPTEYWVKTDTKREAERNELQRELEAEKEKAQLQLRIANEG
ncbi:hypothetical protein PI126_g4906 [Phytophthora idaei]|nr:hypothetical protein PI126_g4906 [Phytophthora idaei]